MKKNGRTFKFQAFDVDEGAIPRDLVNILGVGGREEGKGGRVLCVWCRGSLPERGVL